MPSSYHYLVLPETFNKSHLLDLLCLHLYVHSPSAISIVVIDIIVITPYCLVAQPSVVLLTTARSSMVSNSLRSYMRSHTLRIAQSLRHVYKGRHLRVLPSFQSLSDYKVFSLFNLYSSNDLRSSSQILIQTLPRFQTILLVFAFDKVNRY